MNTTAPLAIMSALPEELSTLLDLMPDEQMQSWGGRQFWCGHWQQQPVVLVLSGIGKVAAAATTAWLLAQFRPRALLFTGVAGGLGPGVAVGDLVVASRCAQHDMDASPLFPRHELPGYGCSHLPTDPDLTQALVAASTQALAQRSTWLAADTVKQLDLGVPRVWCGDIVTGDRFVSTATESQALREAFEQALAVDMESAAVAQVCHDAGVPLAVIRTVSDRADDEAHRDFPVFLHQVARHYSAQVVTHWLT